METLRVLQKKIAPLRAPRERHEITATLPPEILLRQIYNADDQDVAIEAARQIPSIDTARRIQAYVDIHRTFSVAMSEGDQHALIDLILADIIEFSGERLPNDTAQKIGIPEESIITTPATGIIDYADIEATFRVWDEVVRNKTLASVITSYLDQFAITSENNSRQAELLKQAFVLSVTTGTRVADNERLLLRKIQDTGSVNRFNDDAAQKETLRIAAERDRERMLARSALQSID